MGHREQVILVFEDEIYKNFVKEYKDCGELKPLILKLIDAYYYDKSIRDSVDKYTLKKDLNISEVNSIFETINSNIALWNKISADGTSIIEGTEKIENLSDEGYALSENNPYGTSLLKLQTEKSSFQNDNKNSDLNMIQGDNNLQYKNIENYEEKELELPRKENTVTITYEEECADVANTNNNKLENSDITTSSSVLSNVNKKEQDFSQSDANNEDYVGDSEIDNNNEQGNPLALSALKSLVGGFGGM